MKVHVTEDDIDTRKADSRGRINLGTDYADKTVEVAILDVVDGEDNE